MAKIGTLNKQENGDFDGEIKTLQISSKLSLKQNPDKANDKAPDLIAYAGDIEIGAAWKRTSEKGNEFISLSIDDASFASPINAGVFAQEDGSYVIDWRRQSNNS